jgi:hypothetical protein
MVIRSIREHVAAHNWFAVAVDVGIVVLGVFLGTQVNNWNEDRLDRERAGNFRGRLIDELDFDARQYALQFAYYRQAKSHGLAALADLSGTRPLTDRDFLIAAYQLTQVDTTRAKTGVYDEMAAAELVDRLGDVETQLIASDFYLSVEVAERALESILPYRTMLREVMPYDIQNQIRTECGDRDVYYRGRLVGIRTVNPCPLAIDSAKAASAAQMIRSVSGLERQMTRYVASLDEKLDALEVAEKQATQLRERLLQPSRRGPT